MSTKQKKVRKHLTFTQRMIDLGEAKAAQIGLDFNDFVRFAVANALTNPEPFSRMATPEEEKGVVEALDDLKNGRYKIVKTDEELRESLGL